MKRLYHQSRADFDNNGSAALQLISVGLTPNAPHTNVPELAAWTTVTRALLNLNETMTRN